MEDNLEKLIEAYKEGDAFARERLKKMKEKFEELIKLCESGQAITKENVGENILADKKGFQLIIPTDNKKTHGYFLVVSEQGHDCYTHDDVSTHIYHILKGEGEFIVDGERFPVKEGETPVIIPPKKTFYYSGKMLMILEMLPNFEQENSHVDKFVEYEEENEEVR